MPPKALLPFVPTASDPFDRRKAAHLLRRAGFGASPEEVGRAVEQGLEATVEGLFDDAADEEEAFQKTFAALNGRLMNFSDADHVRGWWVYRMRETRAPLREKLTLFWHGHFATSVNKVEDLRLMHGQIETLRRHAWGNFRDLLRAVARDPAMLVWLDGESSTREHPNENFARELMELFTCGIGHYTETDVQEAARAFTGWHRNGAEFAFNAEAHDAGRKHFLGKSGKFDGGDILDILMQQPATCAFLARKLLRFFAAPDPSPEVVAEAAELLDRTRLDFKWFLRELFQSRYFHSADCYRKRISSPVEYVVGTLQTLKVRWAASDFIEFLSKMGQALLAPPNVKGWDGEQKWINSSTWAARVEFAQTVSQLVDDNPFAPNLDITQAVPADVKEPAPVLDALAATLLQGDLSEPSRRTLAEFLTATSEGANPDQFRDDDGFRDQKTRGALALILGLPESHAY